MQILITKALAAGFAASMAVGGHTTAPQMPNATLPTDRQAISPATAYTQNIPVAAFSGESKLDAWIEKLIYLESEGKHNIRILDHNGLHSYGCLQFQMNTFKAYGARYGFLSKDDDAEKLIYSCELQKEITRNMILENRENWRNWYTSVMKRGLGLPPKEDKIFLSLGLAK